MKKLAKKHVHNVQWVKDNDLCIGCGVCLAACPNEAIGMHHSRNTGTILPVIDERICIRCGRCLEVCYGFGVDKELSQNLFGGESNTILSCYKHTYFGYARSERIREGSTSGGAITAVLASSLQQGLIDRAIVTRMEPGNPPRARAYIAASVEEIEAAKGSKYCPVSIGDCVSLIKPDLRYAVVGLPCQLYAIRKLEMMNPRIAESIVLHLGLLCGGMPTYLATEQLLKNHGFDNNPIRRMEYRGGQWPGNLIIEAANSSIDSLVSAPYPMYWGGIDRYAVPFRCLVCNDGFNMFSDVSFGDVWMARPSKHRETSLMIARTDVGESCINAAVESGSLHVEDVEGKDVLQAQQGLVKNKLSSVASLVWLCRLLRKPLPSIDMIRIPNHRFPNLVRSLDLTFGNLLASRRNLWRYFAAYHSLKKRIGVFLST